MGQNRPNVSKGKNGWNVNERKGLTTTQASGELARNGVKSPSNYLRKNS